MFVYGYNTTDLTRPELEYSKTLDSNLLRPKISNQTRTGIPVVRVH